MGLGDDGATMALRTVRSRRPIQIQEGNALPNVLLHNPDDSAQRGHPHRGVPQLPHALPGEYEREQCARLRKAKNLTERKELLDVIS